MENISKIYYIPYGSINLFWFIQEYFENEIIELLIKDINTINTSLESIINKFEREKEIEKLIKENKKVFTIHFTSKNLYPKIDFDILNRSLDISRETIEEAISITIFNRGSYIPKTNIGIGEHWEDHIIVDKYIEIESIEQFIEVFATERETIFSILKSYILYTYYLDKYNNEYNKSIVHTVTNTSQSIDLSANKETKTLLIQGKKLNLLERYEIAKDILDIDNKIRRLNISDTEKYKLLGYILGCNTTNARHIMNGKYQGKIRENVINEYLNSLKE